MSILEKVELLMLEYESHNMHLARNQETHCTRQLHLLQIADITQEIHSNTIRMMKSKFN